MNVEKSNKDEITLLRKHITEYNADKVPFFIKPRALTYSAKDEGGNIIGGIISELGYWGGLHVSILWVADDFRGKGIGRTLLHKVEEEAKLLGATISLLDTFDFQSIGFYLKCS